jgi:hypothetical protein
MTLDQALIALTEVDSKPSESTSITMFSNPSVCKQRGDAAAAKHKGILAAHRQSVAAEGVFRKGVTRLDTNAKRIRPMPHGSLACG